METFSILHAEADFVVCCKAPGIECEHELPSLLASALGGTAQDFYCVHRLDRIVGGIIVYARTANAAARLSSQIQLQRFQKEYLAVCSGRPTPPSGQMRDYLYKDSVKRRSFPVKTMRKGVKEAILTYTTQESAILQGSPVSLVHVKLQTGRFHQIRCQFAVRQLPLLGDGKYGSHQKNCSVALWSYRISFFHPANETPLSFSLLPAQSFPWSLFSFPRSSINAQ